MKIIDAWIDDPTMKGELRKPEICVQVDSMPDVSIEPTTFDGGWSVGKYGPFVKYWCSAGGVDASTFNVRFRSRFPAVVDIVVIVGNDMHEEEGFSLNVTRARQLIRKHDPKWSLRVSDRAAMNGTFLWEPIESDPACRNHSDGQTCGQRPTRAVNISGVDLHLCDTHMTEHNHRFATRRMQSSLK